MPGWIALLLSGGTLINGWWNRRQAQRSDLTAQARNIYVSKLTTDGTSDKEKIRVTFYVENNSDHVIDEVWLTCHSHLIHSDEHISEFAHQLPPDHRLTVDRIVASNPDPFPLALSDRLKVSASFIDTNRYRWQKWADGELSPPIDQRPRKGVTGRLLRLTPKPLQRFWAKWWGRRGRPPLRERRG